MTAEIEGQAVRLKTPTDQHVLIHPVPLVRVAFTRDEQYLVAEGLDGRAWIWDPRSGTLAEPPRPVQCDATLADFSCPDLVPDERNPRVLANLAALLGAQRPDGTGGMSPVTEAERARLLAELKQAQPAGFDLDEMSRLRWHRDLAAAAESAMDWDAAVFHWKRALDGKAEIRIQKFEIPVESRLAYARQVAVELRRAILDGRSRWSVIPPRQPWATDDLVDLGEDNLRPLAAPLAHVTQFPFRGFPSGVQVIGGRLFDVRGFVHLNRTNPVMIPLGRAYDRLHFLHAASQPPSWNREFAGTYQVIYDNGAKATVRLRNPEDVGPYATHLFYAVSPPVRTNATGDLRSAVFWSGQTPGPGARQQLVYLTGTTWELPAEHRGRVASTLELKADTGGAVPLVFAITVEPFK